MVNPSIFLGPTLIGIGVYLLSLKLSQIFHTNNSFSVSLEGLKSRYCVNSHISWYSRELSLLIWSWPRFILNRQSSQTMPSIWWIGNICHTNIYRLTNVLFFSWPNTGLKQETLCWVFYPGFELNFFLVARGKSTKSVNKKISFTPICICSFLCC